MNVLRNLCFAIVVMLVATLPSSAVEVAKPVQDAEYMPVSLFSTSLTDPGCESNEPDKTHRIPGYRFSYQITDMCEYYYPSHTAVAMSVFYIEWVVNFGDPNGEVKDALDELFVEYNSRQRRLSRVYSMDGTYRPGPTVINGLTGERGKYIFVWSGTMPGRLWDTSLVHELVHVAIYARNNGEHGDPDHEGDKYKGWTEEHTDFIKSTNRALEDLDI
jgi:multimeric flavodoxin WrbA